MESSAQKTRRKAGIHFSPLRSLLLQPVRGREISYGRANRAADKGQPDGGACEAADRAALLRSLARAVAGNRGRAVCAGRRGAVPRQGRTDRRKPEARAVLPAGIDPPLRLAQTSSRRGPTIARRGRGLAVIVYYDNIQH